MLPTQGFSTALDRIYLVGNTIDSKPMNLQYFETLKALSSSPSSKFIFPMEFTSMPSLLLGMVGNQRQDSEGNTDSQSEEVTPKVHRHK